MLEEAWDRGMGLGDSSLLASQLCGPGTLLNLSEPGFPHLYSGQRPPSDVGGAEGTMVGVRGMLVGL